MCGALVPDDVALAVMMRASSMKCAVFAVDVTVPRCGTELHPPSFFGGMTSRAFEQTCMVCTVGEGGTDGVLVRRCGGGPGSGPPDGVVSNDVSPSNVKGGLV